LPYKPTSRKHYFGLRTATCCTALIACACWAGATAVSPIDLNKLSEESDLIVSGSVSKVDEIRRTTVSVSAGTFEARLNVATLEVDKVFKGRVEGSVISFRFAFPAARVGYEPVGTGQFGIFFLRKGTEGYAISDPFHPFALAVPGAPESEGTPLDRVVAEVAYVFVSPKATIGIRKLAEMTLMPVLSPRATAALKIAAHDQDLGVQTIAMGLLFERGDISMLDTAAKMLLDPKQVLTENNVNIIAFGIESGVSDPKAVPLLEELLDCRYEKIRRAAATALRRSGNESAIGPH
jgi:hypothetical protein